jgi:prepilin-type N-terminal cleavage/methylation domain-containing protein
MLTVQKLKKGMSLIEVMFALLILLIVILGNSYVTAYGKGQISLRENYRSALQLACQKLEQIKADDYYNIQEGEMDEQLSVGNLSCTLSTQIQDSNSYKNVMTIVCWTQMGKQRDVRLVTSIAPE